MKDKSKRKPLTLPKLIKKTDRLFSLVRRIEESDYLGFCKCITCQTKKSVKEMDAGHFVQREYKSTRWEKNNVWPQCPHCNRFRGGRYSVYRDNLIKILGEEAVKDIEKKKYETIINLRGLCEKKIEESQFFIKQSKENLKFLGVKSE